MACASDTKAKGKTTSRTARAKALIDKYIIGQPKKRKRKAPTKVATKRTTKKPKRKISTTVAKAQKPGKIKQRGEDVKEFTYKGATIKALFQNGYMQAIANPSGKLAGINIVQRGDYQGFTAVYTSNWRFVARGKSAEKLAMRLAKKGHRLVNLKTA